MRVVVVAAVALAMAGCTFLTGGSVPEATFEDVCPSGLARPISVESLIRIANKHGVSLQRDREGCMVYAADVDAASNAVDANHDEYDAIVAREGHVMCHVGDDPTARSIGRVRRTKYADDEETYFDVANVQCAIYPDAPGQVERLRRALQAVARGPVNRRKCPAHQPAPVALEEVIAAARGHAIVLKRDERCIAPGVVAQAANVLPYAPDPNYDRIESAQGEVMCLLRRHPAAVSDEIEEEKGTVRTRFTYRNVACTVAPLPDTNERHVARLRATFEDLRRRAG